MSAMSDVLHELRLRPDLQTDAAALSEGDEAVALGPGRAGAAPTAISQAPRNAAGSDEPR
jgi:hypothetical protein